MDSVRVGRIARALRARRGWRQVDAARAAGISQSLVSLIERGHCGSISVDTLERLIRALEGRMEVSINWRGGALDRLLDERHALIAGEAARQMRLLGWNVETEVTYSRYGERGSIDLAARHPSDAAAALEVKSDLTTIEATLRKMDEKGRLLPAIRPGVRAPVSRILVLPDTTAQRDRVARHATLLDLALPDRTVAVRRWLRKPAGELRGIWFVRISSARSTERRNRR